VNPLVRWLLVLTAVVMIAVGAAVFAFGGSFIGLVIALVGVFDLVTMRLVLGRMGSARGTGGSEPVAAEPPPVEAPADPAADPSYNPYARED
jgi:hypothetical protein